MVMSISNRNVKTVAEAIAARPGLKVMDIVEPGRIEWLDAVIPAGIAGFFALVTGIGGAQWAASENVEFIGLVFNVANQSKASLTVGGCMATTIFTAVYVFARLVGSTRYYADYRDAETEPEEQEDGFVQTGSDNVQLIRLDARTKQLLISFAKRYPAVKLLGVNQWEGRSSPLSRKQYKEVLALLHKIKATRPKDGGGFELNDFGEQQVPKWAAGIFDDVVRLSVSPTPDGG